MALCYFILLCIFMYRDLPGMPLLPLLTAVVPLPPGWRRKPPASQQTRRRRRRSLPPAQAAAGHAVRPRKLVGHGKREGGRCVSPERMRPGARERSEHSCCPLVLPAPLLLLPELADWRLVAAASLQSWQVMQLVAPSSHRQPPHQWEPASWCLQEPPLLHQQEWRQQWKQAVQAAAAAARQPKPRQRTLHPHPACGTWLAAPLLPLKLEPAAAQLARLAAPHAAGPRAAVASEACSSPAVPAGAGAAAAHRCRQHCLVQQGCQQGLHCPSGQDQGRLRPTSRHLSASAQQERAVGAAGLAAAGATASAARLYFLPRLYAPGMRHPLLLPQ